MRRICISALAPVLLASASSGSAFAQVTYVPDGGGQSVYVAQAGVQQYGQQYAQPYVQQSQYGQRYYVYVQQPGYATSVAPRYVAPAPAYAPAAPPRYAAAMPQTYAPAAPRYAPATPQAYAPAAPQAYAAVAAPSYAPPAPTYATAPPAPAPAPASESHGGFLEAIFGGPTIQAHVYQPAQPQYQTPAVQPTVINNPVTASYPPSSQGDMSNYPIDPRYLRQEVQYQTDEKAGTIVIDTPNKFLYLVEDGGRALRYGIGVGRPGFTWAGVKEITAKREWPDWYPPSDMLQRRPDLPRYMPGGLENPLGSRAMYLGSTLYRIHGSNEPWTIGTNVSSGCIRMRNADVEDLYSRVKIGTKVVVI
jgi:lipoprotein-anchoring transpeptidase ErfK/SrfK